MTDHMTFLGSIRQGDVTQADAGWRCRDLQEEDDKRHGTYWRPRRREGEFHFAREVTFSDWNWSTRQSVLLLHKRICCFQVRWEAAGKKFEDQINRLVGDVLLATGFLSYSGPFNQDFRSLLIQQWKQEMMKNEIPFSEVKFLREVE